MGFRAQTPHDLDGSGITAIEVTSKKEEDVEF
jgi:hypothetical protein